MIVGFVTQEVNFNLYLQSINYYLKFPMNI